MLNCPTSVMGVGNLVMSGEGAKALLRMLMNPNCNMVRG